MQRFMGCKERDSTFKIAINPCNFHFQQSTIYISVFPGSVPYTLTKKNQQSGIRAWSIIATSHKKD